jgi:hypothetical protein
MWNVYTMEYCSATVKSKTQFLIEKQMELEDMMLSEISQTQKDKKSHAHMLNIANHSESGVGWEIEGEQIMYVKTKLGKRNML